MFILFDGIAHKSLRPFTFMKPVSQLRIGMLTIKEKWDIYLGEETGIRTADYLHELFPSSEAEHSLGINAALLPNKKLVQEILELEEGEILAHKGTVLAINPLPAKDANLDEVLQGMKLLESESPAHVLKHPWDIFMLNGIALEDDFNLLKFVVEPATIHSSNTLIGEAIIVEEGANVKASVLNASTGPIFISKGAEVMEGCLIRGPFYLGEGATLKMGTKIYGPTTIGPHCKVGGEVTNAVFMGYSNKGHDGFIGNAVIGEWCNLGADTNCSNLKNNYGEVKAWSYLEEKPISTGTQFCGLMMGDHSKCGINTMFNTGTVVGAFSNIFGGGFPDKFIPSFSWGGSDGWETFKLDKAYEVAERMMERRNLNLSDVERRVVKHLFEETKKYRKQ
jgi:UDP-N-acetylglucosamine diphosphorylase/glucosamine-1-phosphate N-acetyltransferase